MQLKIKIIPGTYCQCINFIYPSPPCFPSFPFSIFPSFLISICRPVCQEMENSGGALPQAISV